MGEYPLLQTKLHIPPVRAQLVSRSRLLDRLDAGSPTQGGFPRALTLVSAPAGFGKTSLVSEWAHKPGPCRDGPLVAWLSLDEGDNDPTRFLAYVVAALRMVARYGDGTSRVGGVEAGQEPAGKIGKGVLGALGSPQPPPAEVVLTSLINDLTAIPDRIVLVLDDYHLIETQAIHDALSFLLDHMPPQLHLVIATRDDPDLSLARLRARGKLTELRASDLRFTLSEAAEFFNQVMGLDLSAEDIAALETRTEGWIAGLQLAAISMQGRSDASGLVESFTGSHRFVLDYLIEEVLEQQSESVQTFLLQTAILGRLIGPLCDAVRFGAAEAPSTPGGDAVRFGAAEAPSTPGGDAVRFGAAEAPSTPGGDAVRFGAAEAPSTLSATARTGQDNGRAILASLERANLFIVPLDEERRWYRYHHLFADLLRRRLDQSHPEWVPRLHLRASEWYEQNGFVNEAIEHALCAEELERAAHLIEEQADALWGRGEHVKLRRWLTKLPLELTLSRPHLCIYHAWYSFVGGQQDAAERSLQAAEQVLGSRTEGATESELQGQDSLTAPDRLKVQGRAAAVRAFMVSYQGGVQGIIEYAGRALEYLPEQDQTWRSLSAVVLGDAHGFKGDMTAAYEARFEAWKVCKAAGDVYYVLLAGLKLAATLRAQGRLQQTLEICQEQMQLANEYGLSETSLVGVLVTIRAEVLVELNDLDGALEQANIGIELAERTVDQAMVGWAYMCLMRILYSRGEPAGIIEFVKKMEGTAREVTVPTWIMNQMVAWQTRLWLAQDRLEAATQWAGERGLIAEGQAEPLPEMDFFLLFDYIMLARIRIAQGQLDEANGLLEGLLEQAGAGGRRTRVIEILLLQALAFQAGSDTARATAALERALSLAEPDGFVRIFVDEGPPMAQLLHQAAARGVMPDYTAKLLAAFEGASRGHAEAGSRRKTEHVSSSSVVRPASALVEPLSGRELEVLQLISEGLTNQEIASRLFLSVNTVKVHIRNIYGKLDVHSRTQALVRSKELGLLPDG